MYSISLHDKSEKELSCRLILNELSKDLHGFSFGIAGSYSRGTQKKNSDIDLVVDTDKLTLTDIYTIKQLVKHKFGKDCDVIMLPLLKEEDMQIDKFALAIGLEINTESAYKNIVKEVVWYGKDIR